MSVAWEQVKGFWDYLEYYPEDDEEGYDGIHNGGIKGISVNAPDAAKVDYNKWVAKCNEAKIRGLKI